MKNKNILSPKERGISFVLSLIIFATTFYILMYTCAIGITLVSITDQNIQADIYKLSTKSIVSANKTYENNQKSRETLYNNPCVYTSFISRTNNFIRFSIVALYLFILTISGIICKAQFLWFRKKLFRK